MSGVARVCRPKCRVRDQSGEVERLARFDRQVTAPFRRPSTTQAFAGVNNFTCPRVSAPAIVGDVFTVEENSRLSRMPALLQDLVVVLGQSVAGFWRLSMRVFAFMSQHVCRDIATGQRCHAPACKARMLRRLSPSLRASSQSCPRAPWRLRRERDGLSRVFPCAETTALVSRVGPHAEATEIMRTGDRPQSG
jgi:hypothetical protein